MVTKEANDKEIEKFVVVLQEYVDKFKRMAKISEKLIKDIKLIQLEGGIK